MAKLMPIHPFPARMASSIAWKNIPPSKKPLTILDPMAGSGTTLVVAQAKGHKAVGFDRDPLAVLMARVWCSEANGKAVLSSANRIIKSVQAWRKISLTSAYPEGADEETRAFVRYWFDGTNRRQLAALSRSISCLSNAKIRSILWCALSRLIITKAGGVSLAMDVSHSRPHRVYKIAATRPLDKFIVSVKSILSLIPSSNNDHSPAVRVRRGDARGLPLESKTVDLVITSPPYLNAIDYLRGHKLSLVWMGYKIAELRMIRSTNIGRTNLQTEGRASDRVLQVMRRMTDLNGLSNRTRGMISNYVQDMDKVLSEISRVLVSRGTAIFVVGDSTVYGSYVKNSNAIVQLAELHGLKVVSTRSRALPANRRYLPPPTLHSSGAQFRSRMRREVVICTQKSAYKEKSRLN